MIREIEKKLLVWKNNPLRKPLIIRGARQVGKTYTVKKFGDENYKTIHFIDFERNPGIKNIFEKDKNPKRIIVELELHLRKKINIEKDLLFLDEIQNVPEALSSLRYFYEEMPQLHLIAAGSLIEFAIKNISFPVGRVETLSMHPMNFYEFLIAIGNSILTDTLYLPFNELPENFHEIILEELRKYFFIGGMPEAVKTFLKTESYINVFDIQKGLLETYIQDFSKYAGKSNKQCLEEVLLSTAKNVGKQTHYSKLAEGFSNPTIKNAYNLLESAKVISKVSSVNPSGLPLGATVSSKRFKTIFLDIGLMNIACGLQHSSKILNDNLLNIYEGSLAEQFVGQEILSAGVSHLYYWSRNSRNSSAEVDYIISKNGKIIPIEVKSGHSGKLKSMHLLLGKYGNIENGFVLSLAEYSELPEQKLVFLPIYFTNRLLLFD